MSVPIIINRDLHKALLLANTIKTLGHSVVSEWVVSVDPGFTLTPPEVFFRDAKGVRESDILVAEISVPSHGVGMEIMLAHLRQKKIICLFQNSSPVSRMVQGIPEVTLVEYAGENELVEKLKKELNSIDGQKERNQV